MTPTEDFKSREHGLLPSGEGWGDGKKTGDNSDIVKDLRN